MHSPDPVRLSVVIELDEAQAYALAELCKRIGWADAATLSVDKRQCELMLAACDHVRVALASAGIRVR